jgi:flagellar basal body-associated protein FliL
VKKPGRRTVIILGLPAVLSIGAAAYLMMPTASAVPIAVPDPGQGQHGPMLALEERVVNLQPGGSYRYAKVGLTVELRPASADFYTLGGEARAAAEKLAVADEASAIPLILDALGRAVSAHGSAELVAVDGRATLKGELLRAIRGVLGDDEVLNIYFTDLVMQ